MVNRWFIFLFCGLFISPVGIPGQDKAHPLSRDLEWRNIGPANMMGRIAAVDALHSDYRHVIVATASGGVFKSENAGVTWRAILDDGGVGSIGAVALHQTHPDIIWVGTGEASNRNSSGWGDGLYKSNNGGRAFEKAGLETTHHIAAIALHPNDTNIAYVASPGHLWGYSGDRGLYKTVNGGASWTKLTNGLPDDGKTGCTEIIMHPENPNILFAGFYHRLRQPYYNQSGGEAGGIFKSTDGGATWRKLTRGLPTGETGMIDISIHLANPRIMVAAVEADENLPEGVPGSGVYRSDDGGETWQFLLKHAVRPFYHGQIEIDPINPDNIYVVSRDARLSRDGGETFEQRRWRTDGGDDHDMWICAQDNKIMYLALDQGLRLSLDGGRTFLSHNNMAVGQYYAINVDMRDPYWVIGGLQDNGLWMGPSNSREFRGVLNMHNTWVGEGDGFYSAIDPTDNNTAYIVNHVGFAARLHLDSREHWFITPTPETTTNFSNYADPHFPDSAIRYTIDPGEHWFFGERPDRTPLPPQFRFNWNSPLILSSHDPHTVYFAGNHMFKSNDQGSSWQIISPDLSKNDPARRNPTYSGGLTRSVTGGENYFTIVTIGESAIDPRVIWAGTDCGNVQITRNGGNSWENVAVNIPGMPDEVYVSRVEPSKFDPATCYVSLDNHRYDDFRVYLYKTTDFGRTWTDISGDLPDGYSAYVIREDYVNPELLFAGTENEVYATIDGGERWFPLTTGLPPVAIYDMLIHPRDGDLIAGTHGRSIWILDDISCLRQLTPAIMESDIHIFDNRQSTLWNRINTGRKQPFFEFRGDNPPYGAIIDFYVGDPLADTAVVTISDQSTGDEITFKQAVSQGINRSLWRNFFFPVSREREVAFKMEMQEAIDWLLAKVTIDEQRLALTEASENITNASGWRDLNDIRSTISKRFAAYLEGQPLFPERLMPRTATPGDYEVTIRVGTHKDSALISVRDDPMNN